MSKKGGALDPRIWTKKQVQDYLIAQNNNNKTWLVSEVVHGWGDGEVFSISEFDSIDESEDTISHTIVNGRKSWTILTKWLLEDPEWGTPMIREDIEHELNIHGWEVEPGDGLFETNNPDFNFSQSVYPHMLNSLWDNSYNINSNNSNNSKHIIRIPPRPRPTPRPRPRPRPPVSSKSKSKRNSNSNSNGKRYNGRKKKYTKKRSNKKSSMVIRNGNVVKCKCNSNSN